MRRILSAALLLSAAGCGGPPKTHEEQMEEVFSKESAPSGPSSAADFELFQVRGGTGAAGSGFLGEDFLHLLFVGLGWSAAAGGGEEKGGREDTTHGGDYTSRETRGNKNVVSLYWT